LLPQLVSAVLVVALAFVYVVLAIRHDDTAQASRSPSGHSGASGATATPPTSYRVSGRLVLTDPAHVPTTDGDACSGSGGFGDIEDGAQVTVTNGSGTFIAVAPLEDGEVTTPSITCTFEFEVAVPYEAFYSFTLSHRGTLNASYQQLDRGGWSVVFTLA
jgi:hypothetical protein